MPYKYYNITKIKIQGVFQMKIAIIIALLINVFLIWRTERTKQKLNNVIYTQQRIIDDLIEVEMAVTDIEDEVKEGKK
jgi:hypothetical protein